MRGWITKVPEESLEHPGGFWAATAAVRVARATMYFIFAGDEQEMRIGEEWYYRGGY